MIFFIWKILCPFSLRKVTPNSLASFFNPRLQIYIPQNEGVILAARCERLAIRAEGYTVHQISMVWELTKGLTGRHIPQNDGFVSAAGCKHFAIRAEGNTVDIVTMSLERLTNGLVSCHVPKNDGVIRTARSQSSPIWTKGNSVSDFSAHTSISCERLTNGLARSHIPQNDGFVGTAGCECIAIRTKSQAIYSISVSRERPWADRLVGWHMPQYYFALGANSIFICCFTTSCCERCAIRAEGHATKRTEQLTDWLSGYHI